MAKILLVEDNPAELIALRVLLGRKDGHEVCTAEGYSLALQIFKEGKPFDIAIIDLELVPGSGNPIGFQLCEDLIEQEPELPIIIITGLPEKKKLKARSKGIKNVCAFYPKPLDFVELRKKVKEITTHNKT